MTIRMLTLGTVPTSVLLPCPNNANMTSSTTDSPLPTVSYIVTLTFKTVQTILFNYMVYVNR